MDILYPNLFHALFETDIPRIILRAGCPNFEILKYNQSFKIEKSLPNDNLIGKSFWEIYPQIDNDVVRQEILKNAIDEAIQNNKILKLAPYLIEAKSQWRQMEIVPVSDKNNVLRHILLSLHNITEEVIGKQKIQHSELRERELNKELGDTNEELLISNEELAKSNKELKAVIEALNSTQKELNLLNESLEEKVKERVAALKESKKNLRNLIMNAHFPLMILRGKKGIVEIANSQALQLLSKSFEEIKSKSLIEILPEIEDTPFLKALETVYHTKQSFGKEDEAFYYQSFKGDGVKYISYYYDPIINAEGDITGVIVSANDVTEKVKSRKTLEQIYQEQIELNNEIATINEELEATVEELSSTNEKLSKSQREIELKNIALSQSEEKFRNLIRQAPVGICVLNADDFVVQEVNDYFVMLSGKLRSSMENKSLWEAVPETAEVYAPLMAQVAITAQAYTANEREVLLIRHGVKESVYVDFVFEPLKNLQEKVSSVMILAIDVTDKVLARQKIEDVEERMRLAIEAAEMGTYDYNLITKEIITNPRLNKIFDLEEVNSRDQLLVVLHPDDVCISDEANLRAVKTGKLFYETRIIHRDNSIHWIRVHGNLYFNKDGEPERLLGTILDITEYKFLLQQKDDFISIASHELKTPITSLKASFQLLHRMKDNLSVSLAPRLIEQSNRSMSRISELVEELLDVGRISEGSLKLNKKKFVLNDLLNECAQNVREDSNLKIVLTEDGKFEVLADEHRIEQVITNLINNAIKYAPNSNGIHLKVKQIDSFIRVEVKDNGPGVDLEKLPYLFERYYRADSSGSKVSGLGLGLYISKEIINKHGGNIGVESEVGQGSVFWFTIPKES